MLAVPVAPRSIAFSEKVQVAFKDLEKRVVSAAAIAFRILSLSALTVGSAYFFGQTFFGRCLLVFVAERVLSFATNTVKSIGNSRNAADLVNRIDRTARVVLWSLLIVGALAGGFAGGYILSSASFLYTGIQGGGVLSILHGLANLTFTLGYAIPIAHSLLKHSPRLYDGYDALFEKVRSSIQVQNLSDLNRQMQLVEWAHPNPEDVLRVVKAALIEVGKIGIIINSGSPHDFGELLTGLSNAPLSEEEVLKLFVPCFPHLSDERVSQVIEKYPNIFTISVLADCLPEHRFRTIVGPSLRILEAFNDIERDISAKESHFTQLKNRQNESHAILKQEAEQILLALDEEGEKINQLKGFIRRFPAQPLCYVDLQTQIQAARQLEPRINQVSERRIELLSHLQNFLITFADLEEDPDEREEESYMTLALRGFRMEEFYHLGQRLGIPEEQLSRRKIQRTYEELIKYNLRNRGDLMDQHILDRPSRADMTGEEIIEEIMNRIMNVIRSPVVQTINRIFHRVLSASLIALQIAYQPLSTLAGILYGSVSSGISLEGAGRILPIRRLYDPAPDYINQGFRERMQEIYGRMATVTWSLWFGPLGGFVLGGYHASALRIYGRQLQARIQRWRAAF